MIDEADHQEFERVSDRGGVSGAIELMRSSEAEKDQQVKRRLGSIDWGGPPKALVGRSAGINTRPDGAASSDPTAGGFGVYQEVLAVHAEGSMGAINCRPAASMISRLPQPTSVPWPGEERAIESSAGSLITMRESAGARIGTLNGAFPHQDKYPQ